MTEGLAALRLHSPGNIRIFDLRDDATGTRRRIFLSVPPGPAPREGWPSLVLLDGNATIATAADILRAQAPYPNSTNLGWGVVIGIGYPTEDAFDLRQRSWDLTPPPGRVYPPFEADGPPVRTGGAVECSRFLLQQALPEVARHVPLDPEDRSVFGHSFGGLFVLWLLLTQPSAFRHWIAASPSITWEDGLVFDTFDPATLRGTLHLSAGEWEGGRIAPFQMAGPERETRLKTAAEERTIGAVRDLVARLQPALGARLGFEIVTDATHMSILPAALNRALHCAFALWRGDQRSG